MDQNLGYKLIREHVRLNILAAAKRFWGHSKIRSLKTSAFSIHVYFTCNPLLPEHMFALVSHPTLSQKKFQDAYENWGVKREKRTIFLKLNIKDEKTFYTIYIQ